MILSPRLPPAVALAAGIGCFPTLSAHATPLAETPFAGLEPLAQTEMAAARGGMLINGIAMDFAIIIRSTVEGAVNQGLQTVLTINESGGLGSATTSAIGGGLATLTDNGMTVSLPAGTTIIHDVLDGQVQALIANTTSGVTLTQSTDINVNLPGFTAQSQAWAAGNRAAQASMEAALRGLGGR